jgi:hypothetical protein
LHELAVVAYLLGKNGRDLAERYLLHQTIQEAKDAEDYQRHCEALGYEPLSDEEMARLRERQQLIERFGRAFKNQHGWASELFDQSENPNFRELEELAGMEHICALITDGRATGCMLERRERH